MAPEHLDGDLNEESARTPENLVLKQEVATALGWGDLLHSCLDNYSFCNDHVELGNNHVKPTAFARAM